MENQESSANRNYTEEQFLNHLDRCLNLRICDLENAITLMFGGKFFAAKDKVVGIRDRLINMRKEANDRLMALPKQSDQPD